MLKKHFRLTSSIGRVGHSHQRAGNGDRILLVKSSFHLSANLRNTRYSSGVAYIEHCEAKGILSDEREGR